jgi:hypothetical protein
MTRVVICASRADTATEITWKFSREIFELCEARGIPYEYLENALASPENVRRELTSNVNTCFMHYDHGDENALYGEKENSIVPVIDLSSAALLRGLVVDALACLSAKNLGPEAIRQGCRAYIGYDEVVYVVDSEECKRVMNTSKRELLNGRSAREAFQAQYDAYSEPSSCPIARLVRALFGGRVLEALRGIRDVITGRVRNTILAEFYAWNRAHLVLLGDGDARI